MCACGWIVGVCMCVFLECVCPRSQQGVRSLLQAVLTAPGHLPAHHTQQQNPYQLEAHLQPQIPAGTASRSGAHIHTSTPGPHHQSADITDTSQFRGSILHTPVSQEIVVVVTASKLVAADTLPPDAGGVDGHAEQGWGWQPGSGRERE